LNKDNLKPFVAGEERTRESGRKGGKKSGEARRKRKNMRDTMEIFLSMPMQKGKEKNLEDVRNVADLKNVNLTLQDEITYALFKTALMGGRDGVAAYKLILETMDSVNDTTLLDYSSLSGLSKDEIIDLANMDIDLEEDEDEE
jgi:hypothetical protein